MSRSRLKDHLQRQAFKKIALALLGIALLVFVLVQFGPQLLITFSMTVDKMKGTSDNPITTEDVGYIVPPSLNPLPSATNSAKIKVSGYSQPEQKIKLYVNGHLVDTTPVKKDKSFTFEDVEIKSGQNDIRAKATGTKNQQSEYSDTITIQLINKAPTLDIDSPHDGDSFSKDQNQIKVSGKIDAQNKVTVNDFWAISDDEGKFSYSIHLKDGENKFKVEVTDTAGNKTTKEIKVNYSP